MKYDKNKIKKKQDLSKVKTEKMISTKVETELRIICYGKMPDPYILYYFL